MKSGAVLLPILAVALAGCSAPLVKPSLPTFQSKVGHVSDWTSLADRTAARFSAGWSGHSAIYVAPGPADMPFAAAYRGMLEQDLLQRGFSVRSSAAGAAVLRFGVQTFLYRNNDGKPFPIGYASFWTALGALGVQLRNVSSLDTGAAIAAGAGPIFDILASMGDTTKAEVVLTLTMSDSKHLMYRDSETLYVHPQELPFYWTHMPDFVPQARPADALEVVSLPVRGGRP